MNTNGTGHSIPARPQNLSDVIIECRNVHKTYDTGSVKVHALRGVDLKVMRGEMVAIMGPSGCGKTTLLNCLAGLDSIDEGQIEIDRVPLHTMNDRQKTNLRARKMGFVFQFYNLLPVLSAIENVELPLVVSGVSGKEARKRALDALEQVGLRDWACHRPAQLSGGQRQRVTIARALAGRPAIVWADEPTGNLDTETAWQIVDLLKDLNAEGLTLVLVTHDPAIGESATRLVRMRDGEIESSTSL